jgi:hypothetical protein
MKRKINNLYELRLERERIKMQLAAKETELENSWIYLKHNYKGMIWDQLNPFKNSGILSAAIGLLQPGLLPVVTEVVKGTAKGNPLNGKVIGSAVKYALASWGIKWLRKWLDDKQENEEQPEDDQNPENT